MTFYAVLAKDGQGNNNYTASQAQLFKTQVGVRLPTPHEQDVPFVLHFSLPSFKTR